MRVTTLLAVMSAVVLSGCASQPEEPLAKRLAGKGPEERQEILRLACLNEAEWDLNRVAARQPVAFRHRFKDSQTTRETTQLKELCHQLSTDPAETAGALESNQVRTDAANKCRAEIAEHSDSTDPARTAHMQRLGEICRGFIGSETRL